MKKIFLLSMFVVVMVSAISFMLQKEESNFNFNFNDNKYIRVKRNEIGIIENIPFEQYIVGVVAGEMPVNFDIEALKAQAVAARSYALTKINQNIKNDYDVVDTIANQVYLDDAKLRINWGNSYSNNIEKIKKAVTDTAGEYLIYDGKVVNAFFFSTSVGKTENCVDVFGGNLPYLVSVDSHWDEKVSPVFSVDKEYTLESFYAKLGLPYNDLIRIKVTDVTSTGRIKKILINDVEYTGADIANKLSLRSAFFNIVQNGSVVNINTHGYGHGVGMSQYGALGMAKEGYKYDEILKHYYTGTEIKKI